MEIWILAMTLLARERPEDAVMAVVSAIIEADNQGDLENVVRLYAADGVLMPPGGEPVEGLAAIRAHYGNLFSRFSLRASLDSRETIVSGDWAFDRGTTDVVSTSKQTGETTVAHDKYLMVLRREEDGWRIARLIWNRNP
jgi:uncharacterized protein (TIGR02246 family)